MPTAAKFVAALFFAGLAYLMVDAYRLTLPEGMQVGRLVEGSVAIGLLCGWLIVGTKVGQGFGRAWGLGVRTSITTVVYVTVIFAIVVMIERAMAGRYGGSPMEAVVASIALVLEYGADMLDQRFLLTMLVGGALGGLITEGISRRWS